MKLNTLISIPLISAALLGGAAIAAEQAREIYGINVRFKTSGNRDLQARHRLHAEMQARLLSRSEALSIDTVLPKNPAHASDASSLEALCARYRGKPTVEKCTINRALVLHESVEQNCAPSSGKCAVSARLKTPYKLPLIGERISPFWAQELVGTDLAKAAMPSAPKTRIGIIDCGFAIADLPKERLSSGLRSRGIIQSKASCAPPLTFDPTPNHVHGTSVANLIVGRGIGGASDIAEIAALGIGGLQSEVLSSLDLMRKEKVPLVNVSMGSDPDDPEFTEAIRKLAETAIPVLSAGNRYPTRLGDWFHDSRAIAVGSMSLLSAASSFSQEGPEVVVLAPSDRFLNSVDARGKAHGFGGTSGAAPLVTGALANVISILGDLTAEEAKILLRKTSVATVHSKESPSANGAGMLNALKLVEVAKRMKAAGGPMIERKSSILRPILTFPRRAKRRSWPELYFWPEQIAQQDAKDSPCFGPRSY